MTKQDTILFEIIYSIVYMLIQTVSKAIKNKVFMKNNPVHILLLNCPRQWPRLPPLGIASLAGYLRSHGLGVEVVDLNRIFYQLMTGEIKKIWEIPVFPAFSEKLWDFLNLHYATRLETEIERIICHPAPSIGLSVWHSNIFFCRRLAEVIKQRAPYKRIIIGGPQVTLDYNMGKEHLLEKFFFADQIIIGEGEQSLLNILTACGNGVKIIDFCERADPDSLTAPDFSDFKQYDYRYKNTYPIWMNRGCIRRCAFCVEHTLYKRFRTKSPDLVADEMKGFYRNSAITNFVFYDSLINGDLIKFERFLDLLIQNDLPIKWEAQVLIRPDMPDILFSKMKQAGCYNMFIGLESGSDSILRRMGKGFSVSDAGLFFKKCRKAGLHFEISMIVGFPGETVDDFRATYRFLDENAEYIPKLAQINPYMDLSGAPINALDNQENQSPPVEQVRLWISKLVNLCKEKNIRLTQAYINNLTDNQADFHIRSGTII